MLVTDKFVFLRPLERITSHSSVLIVERISGSGKDAFQMDLKKNLKGRDLYDYSEGELLSRGINCKLRAFSAYELSL